MNRARLLGPRAIAARRAAAVLAALALVGCKSVPGSGPGAGAGSNRACLADNARFAEAWACIRARLTARSGEDTKRDGLIEEGDILARDVKAGKVSEAAARQRLEAGLAHDGNR